MWTTNQQQNLIPKPIEKADERVPVAVATSEKVREKDVPNFLQALWAKPGGKALIVIALGVGGLIAAGGAFKLAAWTARQYNSFKDAANGGGANPPSSIINI